MGIKNNLHIIVIFIQVWSTFTQMGIGWNRQKCFFYSHSSTRYLIVMALLGRPDLRYIKLLGRSLKYCSSLIHYGNLVQIYSKNNKNWLPSGHISWPIFTLFILPDRARWVIHIPVHKFRNSLIMPWFRQIYSKSQIKSLKMLLLHFSTDFDLVCFIW